MTDPDAVRRVAKALKERVQQYMLDVEPLDFEELARIAISTSRPVKWGDISVLGERK